MFTPLVGPRGRLWLSHTVIGCFQAFILELLPTAIGRAAARKSLR
jgi:hypothetical protein